MYFVSFVTNSVRHSAKYFTNRMALIFMVLRRQEALNPVVSEKKLMFREASSLAQDYYTSKQKAAFELRSD